MDNVQYGETHILQQNASAIGSGTSVTVSRFNGAQTVEIVNIDTGTSSATGFLEGSFGTLDGASTQIWYQLGYAQVDNIVAPVRSTVSLVFANGIAHVYQILDLYDFVRFRISAVTGTPNIIAQIKLVSL